MGELLNAKVGKIRDGELLALIEELEHACPVGSRHFLNLPLIHFLTQCVYPAGASEKRVTLKTDLAAHTPILDTRVGKLPDGDLRSLCAELALRQNTALEFYNGNKLVVFLNKTLPKHPRPKKPTAKRSRMNSIAMQRRLNRG